MRIHLATIRAFKRVEASVRLEKELRFEVSEASDTFKITDFLSHKPIRIIFSSQDIFEVENFLDGYITRKRMEG